jgi:Raf kinase inhibitor-like YbhB/YbcL family protein
MRNFFKYSFLIVLILVLLGIFFWQKPKKEISLPETLPKIMKISSPAFENNSKIPEKYTCDGENINPPLKIEGVPKEAKSLVLSVDDPDAPMGTFLHWLVWNIPPETNFIEENSLPEGAVQGKNDFGKENYGGPCPPFGTHRYFFKLYALDKILNLPTGSNLKEVEKEMEGHILDKAQLIGLYQKK